MGIETNIKDHWVLDSEYSDKRESSYENQIVLDTINSIISERKNALLESNSSLNNELKTTSFVLPNIFTKPFPKYKNYISRSQNWVGYVTKISKNKFTAKLIDKNKPTTYEVAQFEKEEVSDGDLNLLKVGAIFYWSVGFANQNGQSIKQSLIRFKRSVSITEEEFDKIIDDAQNLYNSIDWD